MPCFRVFCPPVLHSLIFLCVLCPACTGGILAVTGAFGRMRPVLLKGKVPPWEGKVPPWEPPLEATVPASGVGLVLGPLPSSTGLGSQPLQNLFHSQQLASPPPVAVVGAMSTLSFPICCHSALLPVSPHWPTSLWLCPLLAIFASFSLFVQYFLVAIPCLTLLSYTESSPNLPHIPSSYCFFSLFPFLTKSLAPAHSHFTSPLHDPWLLPCQ